jgi:alpha-D-ribose 1-methylphosphonate 5-triphosphate synthase subunit PhnH
LPGAPPAPCSPAAGALILTLCDGTTPLHLAPSHDTEACAAGSPSTPARRWSGGSRRCSRLAPGTRCNPSRFAIGTAEYPDRSATLIVEMPALDATEGARLTGPRDRDRGAPVAAGNRRVSGEPARFPLGFDCFFTCGDRVAGLPRSTRVQEG